MGDNLVPNGLSRGCKVFCSRSKYPRSQCMKLASQMPSSTPGGRWWVRDLRAFRRSGGRCRPAHGRAGA